MQTLLIIATIIVFLIAMTFIASRTRGRPMARRVGPRYFVTPEPPIKDYAPPGGQTYGTPNIPLEFERR